MQIIYIEGADGIGKTTLIKALKKLLSRKGYRVYATREPDYFVRNELLNKSSKQYNYYCQRLMMGTSHIQKLQDLKDLKSTGEYDIVLVDRTSIISDYVYGSKINLDKNYFAVQRLLEPIIKEVNTELKDDSYLIIGALSNEKFEERLSSREDGQDVYDTYETKKIVKEKYDEVMIEIQRNDKMITSSLEQNHFKDIYIIKFDDIGKAIDSILTHVIKSN